MLQRRSITVMSLGAVKESQNLSHVKVFRDEAIFTCDVTKAYNGVKHRSGTRTSFLVSHGLFYIIFHLEFGHICKGCLSLLYT